MQMEWHWLILQKKHSLLSNNFFPFSKSSFLSRQWPEIIPLEEINFHGCFTQVSRIFPGIEKAITNIKANNI